MSRRRNKKRSDLTDAARRRLNSRTHANRHRRKESEFHENETKRANGIPPESPCSICQSSNNLHWMRDCELFPEWNARRALRESGGDPFNPNGQERILYLPDFLWFLDLPEDRLLSWRDLSNASIDVLGRSHKGRVKAWDALVKSKINEARRQADKNRWEVLLLLE